MYGVLAPQATASVARGAPKNATVHLAPSWRLSDAPDRGPSIFWLFLQFFLCLNIHGGSPQQDYIEGFPGSNLRRIGGSCHSRESRATTNRCP